MYLPLPPLYTRVLVHRLPSSPAPPRHIQHIEVKDKYPSTFERFGIHQVLLIYDDESKERVLSLAEPLGLAFRGSVGILTCSLASVPITPLHKYSTLIAAPAIVFLPIADNHVSQSMFTALISFAPVEVNLREDVVTLEGPSTQHGPVLGTLKRDLD
ncbi:hypothetical protein B566_EDAN006975 [Ephemera danica]|nr:hypothetical protein B566_EDAN006975 [Ephemera danica]